MNLAELGFSPHFQAAFDALDEPGLVPGRVVRTERATAFVLTGGGEVVAHVPRGLGRDGTVVTGDWVAIDPDRRMVRQVLPRRTQFIRLAAGRRAAAQVVAANVDVVFLVMGLDNDFNVRRMERYLTLAHESGASPVVLLTKAGLVDDVEAKVAEASAVAPGVPIHAIDVIAGIAPDAPRAYLAEGVTAALLGSSGVGKSTLVNALAGASVAKTGAVREGDERGKHTTTRREMYWLSGGGALIDTPGMREIQLLGDEASLDAAFPDVDVFATACRFTNCGHAGEPGCAVQAAIAAGELDPERYRSWASLRAELRAHEDRLAPHERRGRERTGSRALREVLRLKRR